MDQNETFHHDLGDHDPADQGMNLFARVSRRGLAGITTAFLTAMGPVGAMLASAGAADAQTATVSPLSTPDAAVLNFALNLEYLEAEFYLRALTGNGLPANAITGVGTQGGVNGGSVVPFTNTFYADILANLALDEQLHVGTLRSALGSAAVARPLIDLAGGFQRAALAAGIVNTVSGTQPTQFNPFADQTSFLLGAFILEDVGVTAYRGAATLLQNRAVLSTAAGILAVEAFHGGAIRAALAQVGGNVPYYTQLIANLRANLSNSGSTNQVVDQGVLIPQNLSANIAPVDGNGLVARRTTAQVINVVTLGSGSNVAGSNYNGGFFPQGLNGTITSGAVT